MNEHVRIAIVGAAMSGLPLARVLHLHGLTPAVFDLDPSPTARPQGGQLDIHEGTGQVALRAAGLHDAFVRIVHAGAEAERVLDRDGVLVHESHDDGAGQRPEVDRGQLRRLLLDSLPPGTVRWGKKLLEATSLGDGRHALRFADGSVVTCDLLVGGDGAWSRIRPLVSDARPTYAGISFVEAYIADAAASHPACARLVGDGSFFALAPDHGVTAHKESNGSLHLYIAVRAPESWLASIDFADTPSARQAVLARFDGWAPAIRALIEQADGPLVPRPIHTLPVGHRWEHRPGVTLLGDAAHLMPPSGEGANLAMLDGAELGEALVRHGDDIEAAVREYEQAMFTRSEEAAHGALDVIDRCYGAQAPHGLVALLSGA